jgi:hypothetical protein
MCTFYLKHANCWFKKKTIIDSELFKESKTRKWKNFNDIFQQKMNNKLDITITLLVYEKLYIFYNNAIKCIM